MLKHEFGSCIPETDKLLPELLGRGKSARIVEGWVTVSGSETSNGWDLLPKMDFLKKWFPREYRRVKAIPEYNDYPRAIDHSWIICNGHIIDPTKDQFDSYGGVLKYYGDS